MVVNLKTKIVKFRKIYVLIPRNADHELGFHAWMQMMFTLQQNTSSELLLISDDDTIKGVKRVKMPASFSEERYKMLSPMPEMKILAGELNENDLLVIISARLNTVSYSRSAALAPRVITRYFGHTNSMILYPEQMDIFSDNISVTFV